MSPKAREKNRPSKAIDFDRIDKWYFETLFTLDGMQFSRHKFAQMRILNVGAIARLKNYIKRNKIKSFKELWEADWFVIGGDRTRYVAMRVLQQAYLNVDDWLDYRGE